MSNLTPNEFLKEHAPDISIVRPEPFPRSLEHYDAGNEKKQKMVHVVLKWLASPLVKDATDSGAVRIQREEEFPKDVADLLKHHKAHPSSVHNVIGALSVILADSDPNLSSELSAVVINYRIFDDLRNSLGDTNTQVWETIRGVLPKEEMDELQSFPHTFINGKFESLMNEIERIAIEVLQKLERKG